MLGHGCELRHPAPCVGEPDTAHARAQMVQTAPGIVLMVTSIVVSRTGDWLRDLLDPTLRGE